MPAPKTIRTVGHCHVRADSKQAVFEQMERFLDECPYARAVSRIVRRSTKREHTGFKWNGEMQWVRVLIVASPKAA